MLLNINKENPNPRLIKLAIDCLQQGGVIVYPTDTVYAIDVISTTRKQWKDYVRLRISISKNIIFHLFVMI